MSKREEFSLITMNENFQLKITDLITFIVL